MKKTYKPKAGDVCEWNLCGDNREVMICSPVMEEGEYIAAGKYDIESPNCSYWYCHTSDLKLIYRP